VLNATDKKGHSFVTNLQEFSWSHETINGRQLRELLAWAPEVPVIFEDDEGGLCFLPVEVEIVLDHRKHCRVHKQWRYWFEGTTYDWPKEFITGAELRATQKIPEGTPIVEELPDGKEKPVANTDRVDLKRVCHFGVPALFHRGLTPRWEAEIEMLRAIYPDILVDARGWVEIPNHKLPEGVYNRASIPLWFLIPPGYSQSAPDNFYVPTGLRFSNGGQLTNYSESSGPFGGLFGVFSWHPTTWRPAASPQEGDNLLTFMRCVRGRLAEVN
jgi:hypothetical protein